MHLYYDSGADGDGSGTNEETDTAEKVTDQATLNRVLRREKEKYRTERKQLLTQIDELRSGSISVDEFDARVAELTQTAEQRLTAAEKRYRTELDKAATTAASAQTKYTKYRIESDIQRAAAEAGVLPKKMKFVEAILRPAAKLIDEKGTETTQITLLDLAPEPLTVDAAIKAMRENKEDYGDFFQGQAAGGLGANNAGPGQKTDAAAARKDIREYMRLRGTPDGRRVLGLE